MVTFIMLLTKDKLTMRGIPLCIEINTEKLILR
jgi:hypothetical protein